MKKKGDGGVDVIFIPFLSPGYCTSEATTSHHTLFVELFLLMKKTGAGHTPIIERYNLRKFRNLLWDLIKTKEKRDVYLELWLWGE